MQIYILVLNDKKQYLIDKGNADAIGEQFRKNENLNFTRRNPKNINKLSLVSIRFGFINTLELFEGEDHDEGQERIHQ